MSRHSERQDPCDVRDGVVLRAPAKINLFLEILGRRPNGYHDLRSVVAPVGIFDDLVMEPAEEIVSEAERIDPGEGGPVPLELPHSDDNLTTRAVRALQRHTGVRAGVRIRIRKRIPVGGGLGGGSVDAAAALIGANRLWGTGLSRAELMEIGSGIGCDVAAVLHGGPVLMEGLGERVTGLAAAPGGWWVVLVNPGFAVSTGDIYARYSADLTLPRPNIKSIVSSLEGGSFEGAVAGLFNSLEETVFRKYPLIEILVEKVKAAGAAGALLSGSGATVFGLAENEERAHQIAERVRREVGAPLWCRVAQTLPDGVMVAHGPLEARV